VRKDNAAQPDISVYSALKEKILKGEFKPAQSLTESEISKMFGISRNTAKKAFLMLQSENLVEMQANRGARVRSFDVTEITDYLNVRMLLEGFVAEITAPIISDEVLDRMESILSDMQKLYEEADLMQYSMRNLDFHKCIYSSCPNRLAADLIMSIRTQIGRFNFKTILVPGRSTHSIQEHTALFNAYKAHDAQKAKEITLRHVSNLLETLHGNYSMLL
jgi:DNA-binding GntR family transcriptional regulator